MNFKAEELQINACIDIFQDNGTYSVYNHDEKKGYVIGAGVYKILVNLNGKNSIKDLAALSSEYSENDVEKLLDIFFQYGFLQKKEKKRGSLKDYWRFKVELINANKLLKQGSLFVTFFSKMLMLGSIPTFALGIIALWQKRMLLMDVMSNEIHNIPVVWMLVAFWLIGFIHEFAHAVVARYYGASVPDVGVLFYAFIPYAYTNLTFISLLDKKWKKICCLLAGIMSNLMLVGIFLILSAYTLEPIFLELAAVNIFICMTNFMVFFKLDGYFMLALVLDENHMRERAVGMVVQGIIQLNRKMRDINSSIHEKQVSGGNETNTIFMYFFGVLSILYVPVLIISSAITALEIIIR